MARDPLLAKIHIAKKDLGLDDATYRAAISMISGGKTDSSAKLNAPQRRDLVEHFKALGWQPKPARKAGKGKPRNMQWSSKQTSRAAQLKKIEALLTIGGKSWAYGDALAKRICKVDKIAWVESSELYKIITALRKQAQREGWELNE
ncbi:MAG: regulatory protein GemA [Desulfuromonadaceae bacterium]|nr:regulatory protein GemA [Desulfuromonadaceae bacterium]